MTTSLGRYPGSSPSLRLMFLIFCSSEMSCISYSNRRGFIKNDDVSNDWLFFAQNLSSSISIKCRLAKNQMSEIYPFLPLSQPLSCPSIWSIGEFLVILCVLYSFIYSLRNQTLTICRMPVCSATSLISFWSKSSNTSHVLNILTSTVRMSMFGFTFVITMLRM